jgi:hypothetical protein
MPRDGAGLLHGVVTTIGRNVAPVVVLLVVLRQSSAAYASVLGRSHLPLGDHALLNHPDAHGGHRNPSGPLRTSTPAW